MKKSINTLKILAEESRLRTFMALDQQELCVCQIAAMLELAASTTSKHLALMYQAGIIDQRKDGRWIYYTINSQWKKQNSHISTWLQEHVTSTRRIKNDRQRLEIIIKTRLEELCKPSEKSIAKTRPSLKASSNLKFPAQKEL